MMMMIKTFDTLHDWRKVNAYICIYVRHKRHTFSSKSKQFPFGWMRVYRFLLIVYTREKCRPNFQIEFLVFPHCLQPYICIHRKSLFFIFWLFVHYKKQLTSVYTKISQMKNYNKSLSFSSCTLWFIKYYKLAKIATCNIFV